MALTPLATVSDICDREGIEESSLSASQVKKIHALLKDASAAVRDYTGQQFTPGTSTIFLRASNRLSNIFPQRPVRSIVSIDGEVPPADILAEPLRFNKPARDTVVVYEHGYDEIPEGVISTVCGIVTRTMNIHAGAKSGVVQQAVGPYSITFASWAVGGNLSLSPDERKALSRYRVPPAGHLQATRR